MQAAASVAAGGVLVVDLRKLEAFDAGHVPDAVNFDWVRAMHGEHCKRS